MRILPIDASAIDIPIGKVRMIRKHAIKDSAYKYSITKSFDWHGLQVDIENEAGTTRSGKGKDGKEWNVTMTHDYGELHGTEGVDGDKVDVFVGPNPAAQFVYIVHTMRAPDFAEYDEDKAFINFSNEAAAREAFFDNYDRPEHFGALEKMPIEGFIKKALSTKENPRPISVVVDRGSEHVE